MESQFHPDNKINKDILFIKNEYIQAKKICYENPSGAVVHCRRLIENICTTIHKKEIKGQNIPKKGGLASIINKLKANKAAPSIIIKKLHFVKDIANEGAHYQEEDELTGEDSELAIQTTTSIVHWYFEEYLQLKGMLEAILSDSSPEEKAASHSPVKTEEWLSDESHLGHLISEKILDFSLREIIERPNKPLKQLIAEYADIEVDQLKKILVSAHKRGDLNKELTAIIVNTYKNFRQFENEKKYFITEELGYFEQFSDFTKFIQILMQQIRKQDKVAIAFIFQLSNYYKELHEKIENMIASFKDSRLIGDIFLFRKEISKFYLKLFNSDFIKRQAEHHGLDLEQEQEYILMAILSSDNRKHLTNQIITDKQERLVLIVKIYQALQLHRGIYSFSKYKWEYLIENICQIIFNEEDAGHLRIYKKIILAYIYKNPQMDTPSIKKLIDDTEFQMESNVVKEDLFLLSPSTLTRVMKNVQLTLDYIQQLAKIPPSPSHSEALANLKVLKSVIQSENISEFAENWFVDMVKSGVFSIKNPDINQVYKKIEARKIMRVTEEKSNKKMIEAQHAETIQQDRSLLKYLTPINVQEKYYIQQKHPVTKYRLIKFTDEYQEVFDFFDQDFEILAQFQLCFTQLFTELRKKELGFRVNAISKNEGREFQLFEEHACFITKYKSNPLVDVIICIGLVPVLFGYDQSFINRFPLKCDIEYKYHLPYLTVLQSFLNKSEHPYADYLKKSVKQTYQTKALLKNIPQELKVANKPVPFYPVKVNGKNSAYFYQNLFLILNNHFNLSGWFNQNTQACLHFLQSKTKLHKEGDDTTV